MTDDYQTFVRRPFTVKAVEITKENIAELAPQIGELEFKDDDPNLPYVQVDRRKVPSVYRVWPGYFLTKMGDNTRCYSPKVFHQQFTQATRDIMEWVEYLDGGGLEEVPQPEAEVPTSQPIAEEPSIRGPEDQMLAHKTQEAKTSSDVEVSPGVTVSQGEVEVNVFDPATRR